eukprot:TRINITY_DN672_c0_g1_i1.p1 TRINITY_DN672_c0_g1~~TRINITY_DN672_c0_g1_i1.p1  ORF type:complete len:717 (+),score=83.41 TRINITY_DN672_c0_g1_i1:1014-3164(+)
MLRLFGKDKSHGDAEETESQLRSLLEEEKKTTKQLQVALADVLQKYEDERRYVTALMDQLRLAGIAPRARVAKEGISSSGVDLSGVDDKPTTRDRSWSTSSAGSNSGSPRDFESLSSSDAANRPESEVIHRHQLANSSSIAVNSVAKGDTPVSIRDPSPKKHPESSVVSQRIAALSRNRASTITAPVRGGMPKHLIHTGGLSLSSGGSSATTEPSQVSPRSPSGSPRSLESPQSAPASPQTAPIPIHRPAPMIRAQSEAQGPKRLLAGSLPDSGRSSHAPETQRSQTPPRTGPSFRQLPSRPLGTSSATSVATGPSLTKPTSSQQNLGEATVPSPSPAGTQSQKKIDTSSSPVEVKPQGPPSLPVKPQQPSSPPPSPSGGSRGRGRPRFQSDAPRSQRLTEDEKKEKAEQTKAEMIRNLDAIWILQYSDCFFEKQLGKGVSSTVYKGKHKDKEVALKVLRLENQQRDLDDFKKELEVMTKLDSPQVIKFFGATFDPKLCIVMEYCPNGALFQYLQDPNVLIDWNLVLRWSREAALGLLALHNFKPQIVHRDFKSLNLLLDGSLNIKVCDFGLSRFVQPEDEDKRSTLHTLRGTYAYAAPEVFHKEQYTTKSDVYSYGIVVWELIMKAMKGKYHRPYGEFPELIHDFQVLMQATKGVRPTIPANCPAVLAALVKACWAPRPEERPACADLIVLLEVLQKDYDAYKQKWNSALYTPPS